MPLSIGIEIEGVALRRAASSTPFPRHSEHQLGLIVQALRDAGLSARVYIPSTTRGTGPDYRVWNVTLDVAVSELTSGSEADESAFQTRFGFEIVSPVFYNTEGDNWKLEFERGIQSISRAVAWKANRSTGFHVHVGRGTPGNEYTLHEIKKQCFTADSKVRIICEFWEPLY